MPPRVGERLARRTGEENVRLWQIVRERQAPSVGARHRGPKIGRLSKSRAWIALDGEGDLHTGSDGARVKSSRTAEDACRGKGHGLVAAPGSWGKRSLRIVSGPVMVMGR